MEVSRAHTRGAPSFHASAHARRPAPARRAPPPLRLPLPVALPYEATLLVLLAGALGDDARVRGTHPHHLLPARSVKARAARGLERRGGFTTVR